MTTETTKISSFGTARTFMKQGTCSETLFAVINRAYGHPLPLEERAVMALAGGIAGQGYQCGMLWGASLAAGAQAYRLHGATPRAEAAAVFAARRLAEALDAREGSTNCLEITETDWSSKWQAAKFLLKGGGVSCMRRVMSFAKAAFEVIEESFWEFEQHPREIADGPVSCAAELARKMGATEIQAVMAAGLAGGIGLSGGGCGALGATIWLEAIGKEDKPEGFDMMTPAIQVVVDRFMPASGHEYECAEIVGRKFEDPADHAAHLCAGGCSRILDALATPKEQVEAA